DALHADAILATVDDPAAHASRRSKVQVRIGAHDDGGVAAEFERDLLATGQCSTERAPSGSPACLRMSASKREVRGVCGAGLSRTVFPTASAGASLCRTRLSGKLNGVMASTGPIGK